MRRLILTGMILLSGAGLQAAESVDSTLPASASGRVSIEHHSGNAVIRAWDRPEVMVRGTLDSRAEDFVFEDRGGEIRIEVEMPRDYRSRWPDWNGEEDDLEIYLPGDSFVEYENIDADLDARDIAGGVELSSVNGGITVQALKGRIRISTVNGAISSQDLTWNIHLETVNGSIRDRASRGEEIVYESVNGEIRADSDVSRVRLETVNADSELELGRVEQLRASNVNGDTRVRLELAGNGEVSASSVSGSLEFLFQPGVSAHFDAESHAGGTLHNRLTDDEPVKDRYGPSRRLRFSTAEGNARVRVSTVTGTVVLGSH